MSIDLVINLIYVAATVMFIYGLKMMSSPATARNGNLLSAVGMTIAIIATLWSRQIISYQWIIVGLLVGSLVGIVAAKKVAMTEMPEMVALLNGCGGLASLFVGWAAHYQTAVLDGFTAFTIFLSILIGGITFTGSVIAWAKLKGVIDGKPVLFKGQKPVNALLFAAIIIFGIIYSIDPASFAWTLIPMILLSFVLGVLAVIPIGGADMPVVISLLNSYSGLAACAAGFVILNNLLIVAGALVGASGIILTQIMCKAMNRSLGNVLFSGFGATATASGAKAQGEAKPISAEDTYYLLEAARSVVFVPGYGLAVAQAQHTLKELSDLLEANGCEVRHAIHPVAGRMPGHMNVLLAEASVPYEQLVEMDDINPIMPTVDVCVVIGANDVVNPAAREDETSSIYGMPIINVDYAKTVIVLKRSMASGFAGIENPLFFNENTRMLFGDAKHSLQGLVGQFKE